MDVITRFFIEASLVGPRSVGHVSVAVMVIAPRLPFGETFERIVHAQRSDETLSEQPIFWLFTVAQRWGVLRPLEVQRGHRSGSGPGR